MKTISYQNNPCTGWCVETLSLEKGTATVEFYPGDSLGDKPEHTCTVSGQISPEEKTEISRQNPGVVFVE